MDSVFILLAVLTVAVIGKAKTVAAAVGILLILKLTGLEKYIYPVIEKNGISWGIVILVAAILMPIADGEISVNSIKSIFTSWIGIAALLLSFITTYLSGKGLDYLTVQGHGEVMPSMITGAVVAAAFFGGVPVGPLITCGILAVLLKLIEIMK